MQNKSSLMSLKNMKIKGYKRHIFYYNRMEYNDKLDRLKKFIKDEYVKEQSNPVITLNFKVAIPLNTFPFSLFGKCPSNIFVGKYEYLNGITEWFRTWIHNEFPNKQIKIYMYDELNSDLYVELH